MDDVTDAQFGVGLEVAVEVAVGAFVSVVHDCPEAAVDEALVGVEDGIDAGVVGEVTTGVGVCTGADGVELVTGADGVVVGVATGTVGVEVGEVEGGVVSTGGVEIPVGGVVGTAVGVVIVAGVEGVTGDEGVSVSVAQGIVTNDQEMTTAESSPDWSV